MYVRTQGCEHYVARTNQDCQQCHEKLTKGKKDQYRDRTNGKVSDQKKDSYFDLITKYPCSRCGSATEAAELWCCEQHFDKVCTSCHASKPVELCCCGREEEHHPWVCCARGSVLFGMLPR